MALPAAALAIGAALRLGAGVVARGTAGLIALWGGRILAALMLSGVLPKAIGVALKVGMFASTYAAIRVVLEDVIFPMFQTVLEHFPDSTTPIRFLFQLMVATQHIVPWDDVSLCISLYLEFMVALLAWRLAMLAYGLSSKVVSEIGDA